ncbi:MFS transporter [Halobacteriovorax sp. CON-3]|uniref:MFS transporter n=1 Tax=Halobacteriovorax sp. CON-3 TaxID=3157710 RepID=UPI0037141E83
MSSQLKINNFTKAISCLCFVFGAAQTILLGLIPKIAMVTNLDITSVLIIYGISIFFFLFMTKEWAALFSRIQPKNIYRIGLYGLLLSTLALLATFTCGNVELSLACFILSRVIYAMTASSIIPFSQVVKIKRFKDAQRGVLETTVFLNIGRLIGLILGGLLAYNLYMGLVILAGLILLSILLGFERGQSEIEMISVRQDQNLRQIILPLLLIPLAYTFMTSFFHMSMTDIVGDLFIGQIKQSATIYWTLTIASLVIIVTQLILKKMNLINSKFVTILAIIALLTSFYSFYRIDDLRTLYGFIILFSFGAAIVPILYMGQIYKLNPATPKQVVASEISFYQTLGNALGALSSGVIIKFQLTNYMLIFFVALVIAAIFISLKYNTFYTEEGFGGVTNG